MLSAEAQTSPPTPSSKALVPSPHTASTIPHPPSPSPSPSPSLVSLPIKLLELIFKNCDTYALQELRYSCKTLSLHIPAYLFKEAVFSVNKLCPFPTKFMNHVTGVKCNVQFCQNPSERQEMFEGLTEFLNRFHPSQLKTLTLLPFPTTSDPIIWPVLKNLTSSLECLVFSVGDLAKLLTPTTYEICRFKARGFFLDREWERSELVDDDTFWTRLRKIEITINNYISKNDILTLEVFADRAPNVTTYFLGLYNFHLPAIEKNLVSLIPISVTNVHNALCTLTNLEEILNTLQNLQSIDHFILSDDRTESLLAKSFANIRFVNFKIQPGARKPLFKDDTWKPIFPNAKIIVKPHKHIMASPQKIKYEKFVLNFKKF